MPEAMVLLASMVVAHRDHCPWLSAHTVARVGIDSVQVGGHNKGQAGGGGDVPRINNIHV